MFGIIVERPKNNEPIEAIIAEAIDLFEKRFARKVTLVRIHPSNPKSIYAPDGLTIEYTRLVDPGSAWAGVRE